MIELIAARRRNNQMILTRLQQFAVLELVVEVASEARMRSAILIYVVIVEVVRRLRYDCLGCHSGHL